MVTRATVASRGEALRAPPRCPAEASRGLKRRLIPRDIRDPWRLFSSLSGRRPSFGWHDPRSGLSFAACGVAAALQLETDAVQPMAQLSSWARELAKGTDAVAPELPMVMVGAAFDPTEPWLTWSGWPRAYAFVPELILFSQRGGASGVLCHGDVDSSAATVERVLRSVDTRPAEDRTALRRGGPWQPRPSAQHYRRGVGRLLAAIEAGAVDKAVLARAATMSAPAGCRMSVGETALALRSQHPDALCFALALGERCFLGATPEILAAVTGGVLRTQAVAGTSSVATDPDGQRLCGSDKERREQACVVAGIERSLSRWGSLVIGAATVRRAGAVQHLVSELRLSLPAGVGVLEAAAQLHPTAALCGVPRQAAKSWIAALEEVDRGWYGGPIGWCSPHGDGVVAVAIRSLLLSERQATAFAGAGIVRGSRPESEWQETEDKLSAARAAIRLTAAAEVRGGRA